MLLILISFPTPWCRQRCSKLIIVLWGVTDLTFTFYELCFWEKVIFGFVIFFSPSPSLYNCSFFLLQDKDYIYHACTWNYNEFYVSLIDRWILFFALVFYIELPDLYAIIAKDIFIFVLTYTPLIRDWFISQIFIKSYMYNYD